MSEERRCTATTAKGQPCQGRPMRGKDVCRAHTGDPNYGRPTRLTDDLMHRLTAFIRGGNYLETACQATGIGVSTFYGWLERGEADQERNEATLFSELVEAVARARAEGEAVNVAQIATAAQTDWRAAAWRLEHMLPEKFASRAEVRHSGRLDHRTRTESEEPVVAADEEFWGDVASVLEQTGVIASNGHGENGANGQGEADGDV